MSDPDEQGSRESATRTYAEERRGDRLPPREADGESEPYNPTWRSQRLNRTGSRRTVRGLPSSPQEVSVWLQQGGWRWVAVVAAVFVLALIFILMTRNPRRALQTADGASATSAAISTAPSTLLQSTVTVPPQPTTPPQPAAFVVSGTEGQGLFLRADHTSSSEALETLPDGTRVERIGDDFTGPDRVWRNVRAPSGKEGWVATDFLQPAPNP